MINGVLGKNVIFLLRSIDTNWVWIELFEIWSTAYIQFILGDYHSYTVKKYYTFTKQATRYPARDGLLREPLSFLDVVRKSPWFALIY